jgi:sulfopyruvate decarboxylase TPP-binding subunit
MTTVATIRGVLVPMFDGPAVTAALKECGVTHVLWVPDSELGQWESALAGDPALRLIRVCREGEAIAIAGGLLIGGKKPVVMLQCTGLFEAGDALRNFVHDLRLPLFLVIGVRSWGQYQKGQTSDTCPQFVLPILDAWRLSYTWLDSQNTPADLAARYRQAQAEGRAAAVLLPE